MSPISDRELGLLYARALVAVMRADHVIRLEEGLRLTERLSLRCPDEILLEDLLLEPPLAPEQLAQQCTSRDGPFRGVHVHTRELATALVGDGIAIMLAKGHATEAEAYRLWRFAEALGLSADEFGRMTAAIAPWFPVTD